MTGHEQPPGRARMPSYPLRDIQTASNVISGVNNHNSGSSDRAAFSPGKSQFPPTSAEVKEFLRSKRPAESPINLNVEKRVRTNASSEQSKSNAASPSASRQNSITAAMVPSPVRRSSAMSSGDNIVYSSRDPRRQGKGYAGSASPLHAASPVSMTNGDAGRNGSGNTTPVHGAPPAPSMVPQSKEQVPQKLVPVSGAARGVASIRQIAMKKQALPGVRSENSALASIRAKNIELQNQVKIATEKLVQVQKELRKDTSQRDHVELELKAQLSQLQDELKTEHSQRIKVEERLQKLEEMHERSPITLTDPNLSEQVHKLLSRVEQLESLPNPNDNIKHGAHLDTDHVHSQMEDRVKQSIQSDIKAYGTKITGVESKCAAIEERLEKLQPESKDILKQSLKEEIRPLQAQLTTLVNSTESITSRIDGLVAENNKSRLDKLTEGLDVVMVQSQANETRVENLAQKEVLSLKEDMRVFKEANLSQQLSDLKSEFASQKHNVKEHFSNADSELSKKSTIVQYEQLEAQLKTVSEAVKSYVKENVQQQVHLHVQSVITPLKEDMAKSIQNVKRDIEGDIVKIRQDVGENQTALSALAPSTSTLIERLHKDVASIVSTEARHLRSEISDLESSTNSTLAEIEVKLSNLQSATTSDIRGLRAEMHRSRKSPGLSSANPGAVVSSTQDFVSKELLDSLHEDLEQTAQIASEALWKADSASETTSMMTKAMDGFRSEWSALEEATKALQEDVKALREQVSTLPAHAGPVTTSFPSLSKDTEPTNTARKEMEAGYVAIEDRLGGLELAIKSLTLRYENITTEYLHQSMVHWITQNYPSAPNFLQQLQLMKADLGRIGDFVNNIAWIQEDPAYSQQLLRLAHNTETIERLLHDKDKLGHPATWEEIDSIRNRIKTEAQLRADELRALRADLATERSHRLSLANEFKPVHAAFGETCSKVDSLKTVIENLDVVSVHDLNTVRANLATERTNRESLQDAFRETRSQFETLKTRVDSDMGSVGDLISQNQLIVSRLKGAEDTITDYRQALDRHDESIGHVQDRLEQHTQKWSAHEQLINKFNANVATLMVTVYELQNAILAVNRNLRGGGIKIEFSYTFSAPP